MISDLYDRSKCFSYSSQMQALLQVSKHEVVHVNYTYKQMNRETVTTRRLRPPR